MDTRFYQSPSQEGPIGVSLMLDGAPVVDGEAVATWDGGTLHLGGAVWEGAITASGARYFDPVTGCTVAIIGFGGPVSSTGKFTLTPSKVIGAQKWHP